MQRAKKKKKKNRNRRKKNLMKLRNILIKAGKKKNQTMKMRGMSKRRKKRDWSRIMGISFIRKCSSRSKKFRRIKIMNKNL